MLGTIIEATLLVLALYFSLMASRSITTRDLATLIAMVGLPTWAWFDMVYPWFRLFEDRIKPASDFVLALGEKDAQVEVFRDDDLRVIRFVRYSATCSICGATVYLDDGSPDFLRRRVGRCSESPRESMFGFDRVTREGQVLRGPHLANCSNFWSHLCNPAVQDFGHVDHTVIKPKTTGLLLAAVAGVTGNAGPKWDSQRFIHFCDLSSLVVVRRIATGWIFYARRASS